MSEETQTTVNEITPQCDAMAQDEPVDSEGQETACTDQVEATEANDVDADAVPPKERYFGSVRFFKNLILLTVIIMIAVPSGFCIHYVKELHKTERHLQEMTAQYDAMCQSEMIWYGWEAESPYADLYPDFYAPQPLSNGIREDGVIYLTFDDGPSARTGEVLDTLKEKNVKATFFVIGSKGEANEQMLRRIVDEGHTLAMHSYSHNYTKIYASVEAYLDDMYQLFSQIKKTTGVTPTLFRFPGGSINSYNNALYQELIAEMLRRGFVPFDWNISSMDAATSKLLPPETLVNNVVTRAQKAPYGIVLMHDSAAKTTTAKAVGPMIDRLRDMGFTFEALTPDTKSMLFAYSN